MVSDTVASLSHLVMMLLKERLESDSDMFASHQQSTVDDPNVHGEEHHAA